MAAAHPDDDLCHRIWATLVQCGSGSSRGKVTEAAHLAANGEWTHVAPSDAAHGETDTTARTCHAHAAVEEEALFDCSYSAPARARAPHHHVIRPRLDAPLQMERENAMGRNLRGKRRQTVSSEDYYKPIKETQPTTTPRVKSRGISYRKP